MIATNGRMLSYEDFARTILKAGLNSLVFSIHGHTAKLHDSLTRAPGSFKQLNKGVKNVQKKIKEISLDESHSGRIIFALSKSKEKAVKAADYFYKKMFISTYGYKFGKLMGYPECCLKFGGYLDNKINDPDNFGFKNPGIESLKRSRGFDWHLNIFTTPPISHFPCSLTCKKSIEYVKRMLESLDYIDKERSLILKNYLTRPASLYWTWADRILLYGDFKPYILGTGEIKYHKIKPMITSGTFYQKLGKKVLSQWKNIEKKLLQGNKLIVTDDLCTIYLNKKKVFETKKDNKYIPVLVKSDILH